jgi:glycerol-3-phosphate O-acyltransferase
MKILGKKLVGFVSYRRMRIIESILNGNEAKSVFIEVEQKKHQPIRASREKAKEILLELSSASQAKALFVCYWIVTFLQKMMFREISTYGDELKEVYKLTQDGKIIFYLPNHKSHMDYLLLSYILFNQEIAPPHIAAGVNLSFFPVGGLFRRTGAYFIRRKIAGNFLYTRFLQIYFDWMLKEKISQEFYMEGGRSRDGKIREAQSGIFTLFIEQIRAQNLESEVYFVPTSITYDRLPEIKSLQNELLGAEKAKESALSLLKSLSILWTNHGDVHVQFGKPLALNSLLEGEFTKQKFSDLSHRIFSEVQQNKIITVSSLMALVLLSTKDFIEQKDVFERIHWLTDFLKPCRVCISTDIANMQRDLDEILPRFEKLGWFTRRGSMLDVSPSKRIEMNYYKNDLFPTLLPFYSFIEPETQKILMNEFPYSNGSSRRLLVDEEDQVFLRQVIEPTIAFYAEVSKQIKERDLKNIMNKEVQKTLLRYLQDNKSFPYKEMLNTEALRASCSYFHQNKS